MSCELRLKNNEEEKQRLVRGFAIFYDTAQSLVQVSFTVEISGAVSGRKNIQCNRVICSRALRSRARNLLARSQIQRSGASAQKTRGTAVLAAQALLAANIEEDHRDQYVIYSTVHYKPRDFLQHPFTSSSLPYTPLPPHPFDNSNPFVRSPGTR